ncbi:hypothetical protein CMO92_02500 [Candidatus Woesearchaeota archaeon]|nr:hypothetical protein [Candidatus Woesearchaeota archaeon]
MTPEDIGDRTIIGLTEKISVLGKNSMQKELVARIDTGATKSSMDISLASKLKLGPVVQNKLVKSAHGVKLRPMIEVEVVIRKKKIKETFTLADRSHMKYPVLIGQNVLNKGFLIDPMQR